MTLETIASSIDLLPESGQRTPSTTLVTETAEHLPPVGVDFVYDLREALIPESNIVSHCIYKNDPHRLTRCFEDEGDPYKDEVLELLNTRDSDGKSPLDLAACLGRLELTKELLLRGADITNSNSKGYSPLHYAAAWGRLNVLKVHIDNNGDLQQVNIHNERPRETALRYHQEDCVAYLEWAEAKSLLQKDIRTAQETIMDADKALAGRITKEEKNISLNLCKEKQEWLDTTLDATLQDFISHRRALFDIVTPVLQKLNDPTPERKEKR